MIRVPEAKPYHWPYDGSVPRSKIAVLVCGTDAESRARITSHNARWISSLLLMLEHAAAAGVYRIGIGVQWPARSTHPDPPARSVDTELSTDVSILAAGLDGFHGSPLDSILRARKITHLLLTGLGFETSVHSTLRRANDIGYECLTVSDACVPNDPATSKAAVSTIEMSGGIFGAVTDTGAVIAAIEQDQPQETA